MLLVAKRNFLPLLTIVKHKLMSLIGKPNIPKMIEKEPIY